MRPTFCGCIGPRLRRSGPLLAALLWLWPGHAPAAVTTTGCANVNVSCTMAELLSGATIEASQMLFSSFEVLDPVGADLSPLVPSGSLRCA